MKTPFSLLLKSFALSHSLRFCMSMLGFLGLLLIHPASFAQTAPQVEVTTNVGTFVLELYPEAAPKTVKNFLHYVNSGFYNGTIFHRVIDNFMIQGGGFEPGMKQKATKDQIENEANNGLKNSPYSIAMARTSAPHSASSQFFINVGNNDFLNYPGQDGWGYCVFGNVVEGMEVVDKIKAVKTGRSGMHQDVPVEDVVIIKAEIV